jgi:RNA recognition motif-containing protein
MPLHVRVRHCVERAFYIYKIMEKELREILDKVYANKMKPDEAQWKICVLFNVMKSVCIKCDKEFLREKHYHNICDDCERLLVSET